MDAYEQSSGVYVDSLGNELTYFAWANGEPTSPMRELFVKMFATYSGKWIDLGGDRMQNILCAKCHSDYYRGPQKPSQFF